MASPSLASRPQPELTEPVPSVMSAPRLGARGTVRARQGHPRRQERQPVGATGRRQSVPDARRQRGARARHAGAAGALDGRFEFGIFIYVWTWVLMIGALSDLGLSSASRRFIPEYTELGALESLRGFLARLPLARVRHRHRHRRDRRASASGCSRPRSIISPWCRSISPASPFRSTAWCRCRPASRNPTTGRTWR